MDRLHAMTVFVAVVDTGGFAAAARKLDLSPPVVTRAVAELEERLGLRLLTRTTRVVRVTDAGARYAEDCRRILAEIEEAEVAAAGTHAAPRGTLTITAPVLFGQLYVVPVLARYLQQHPQVEAQCLFLDRMVNIVEEGIDVAVRIGELPDSSLQAVRVGRVRRMLVASPSYLAAAGVPRHPADLAAGHTLLSAGVNTPVADWRFNEGGRSLVLPLPVRLRTTSNGSVITAALAHLGIARLLSYQAAPHLRDGTLVPVLEAFETAPLPIHVVHLEGRRATGKVRGFIDMAVASLRADPFLN
ncbi:LysR family transcriptional regulator [Aquincola tertiaricarbonis]|uniref:LysR family transcriptional regulator n=1 Tax=Aquincola tertiaricarbonis TaxID=391953 RepID=UPI000614A3E7|nr:LysR family transcriptional regulator [Aquincola tertiaricarbonis]